MYDPTFELFRREYGAHPERNEYQELLNSGFRRKEAAAILDAGILDFESWIEMYGAKICNEEAAANERMVCTPPIATERA